MHHDGIPYFSIVLSFINLALLIGVLAYFTKDNIRIYIKSRHDDIITRMKKNETDLLEAKKQLELHNQKLAGLQHEARELLKDMKESAELHKKKVIEEAKQTSVGMIKDVEKRAADEVSRTKNQLIEEIVKKVIESAEVSLKKQMKDGDHDKLVANFENESNLLLGSRE